ncbi:MAG TPA: PEP-CTERM sorting domain-containing protein [Phycisphaerae bacterium]|nr:PEP-CTERM sorting domain-containing protein [Phycisphaerae bacterium]HRR87418.1 PEP-CTERM sorting domain-containing protein [Phycisphaerae bacterium]
MKNLSNILVAFVGFELLLSPAVGGFLLENGGMEDPFAGSYPNVVAVPWTYYSYGGLSGAQQSKETTVVHGGLSSQRLAGNATNNAAYFGIRQTIDANVGDAFMFGGWVWPDSAGTYNETSIRVAWDGGTAALDATVLMNWLPLGSQKQQWHQMVTTSGSTLAGGNATATTITVFLHSDRNTSNGSLLTYWDDVVGYHTFVPPAPILGNQTPSSFEVNVDPGGNSGNLFAQYAITVGGGGYTLGSDWLQADGSVGGSPVWRTDAQWGTTTVTGVAGDTIYSVQVKARYDSVRAQETYLGPVAMIPEPVTVALLGLGIAAVIRRR